VSTWIWRIVVLALLLVLAGCAGRRPEWKDDPRSSTLAFWAERPASARVVGTDYAALWNAAEEACSRFGFPRATTDYRGGLLTTQPTISPQFFEVWHDELRAAEDVAESSLATVRRRIRFEFSRTRDGRYMSEPKVIVERLSLAERRITNAIDYRGALGPGTEQRFGPSGTAAPGSYWYAIGRDADLEASLANRMAQRAEGRIIR